MRRAQITAKYDNGVLTMEVPKAADKMEPQSIDVF